MPVPQSPELIARKEAIREMWADGWSGGQIADKLGVSRSSVIGMVDRMDLPSRKTSNPIPPRRPSKPLPPEPVMPDEPVSLDLAMEQLTDKTCRYPHGSQAPYSFCGQAVTVDPYCGFHHGVCCPKPPPRVR